MDDIIVPQPRLVSAAALPTEPIAPPPLMPVVLPPIGTGTAPARQNRFREGLENTIDVAHRYSMGTFALLFLVVGVAGVQVGNVYWTAHVASHEKLVEAAIKPAVRTIAGLNIIVPAADLPARLQTITTQPASITVGDKTVPIGPDTIKDWLQVTPSKDKSEDYIRIKADAISNALTAIATQSVKAPVDQVTSTAEGSPKVIVAGRDGVKLANPADLKSQADAVAKTVMDSKGLNFNAPLAPQAFALTTPTNIDKLIEVNVVTKQMYLFDKGVLFKSYPISAGAPETPTPIGEFHTYAKFPVQDMKGTYPKPYVQPHVRWISYFLPGGYAVHGNYWRPTSWFGNINSSHGCVSLPDDQAKEVYDWAPLGTTVITHV